MQKHATVTMLKDLVKQKPAGRMTIGIDLGDRRSHFCVLNEQAQVIARGFLPTTITAFRREFEGLPPSLVAIEAGTHSLWVCWSKERITFSVRSAQIPTCGGGAFSSQPVAALALRSAQ